MAYFVKNLCSFNVKSCNKILFSSYGSFPTAPLLRKTLVEDLIYKFRIKNAQKQQLSEAQQGLTPLTKITVEDVRSIWIHTLIAEKGLPSSKVFLSQEIFVAMEAELRRALVIDADGLVDFEDYLPTMVCLIRTKVTPEDEEELANELFNFWFPEKTLVPGLDSDNYNTAMEDMRSKTRTVITAGRPNYESIKKIKNMKKFLEGSGFNMWLD